MATYSSHRLIMGKEEIGNFFCLVGDIWKKKITEMFIEYSCIRKPIGDISLHGLGQDWTLRRYILHLNDI